MGRPTPPTHRMSEPVEATRAELRGNLVARCQNGLAGADGLATVLFLLNGSASYRFTAIYEFAPQRMRSVRLFDRRNPSLRIGADIPLEDAYCQLTAADGYELQIANSLEDPRLTTHAARESVQSHVGVLLRTSDGRRMGTLCHFDFVPHPPNTDALAVLHAVRPFVEAHLRSQRGLTGKTRAETTAGGRNRTLTGR